MNGQVWWSPSGANDLVNACRPCGAMKLLGDLSGDTLRPRPLFIRNICGVFLSFDHCSVCVLVGGGHGVRTMISDTSTI